MTLPRSDHFNGKTFFQPHHEHAGRLRDVIRWKFLSPRPQPWRRRDDVVPRDAPNPPPSDAVSATWIGHASFLIQTARTRILIDPVFSERASPVPWAGPRRIHPPGIRYESLPAIDAVLVSHDHYDHCDMSSLRTLAADHDPTFVAPLRNADLFLKAGGQRLCELDWWETLQIGTELTVTLTPSKHWSNRIGTPRNHRLWGGFYLKFGYKGLWFVGDSGYDAEIFRAVRRRCGPPDLMLVPIGAYEPRWFMEPMHLNPADAVRLHLDVGSRLSVGMHWGTFQLTDEGRDEPIAALAVARRNHGVADEEFRTINPGESLTL